MKAFFNQIHRSANDFKFYNEVKNFSLSETLKYIFLLVLLVSFAVTVRYGFAAQRGMNILAYWANKNLPVINIQNGLATVDAQQPYKIAIEDGVLLLDTTGQTTSLDGYGKGMLLTKDKLLLKQNEAKTVVYSLSKVKSLRIDKNFFDMLKRYLPWAIAPFMLIGLYIYFCIARFLQIFLFSILAFLISALIKAEISYGKVFNICVFAITPSMLLGAMAAFLMKPIAFFGLIYSALYIIYLVIGIVNAKERPAAQG